MLLKSEKIGVLMVLVVVEDSVRGGDIGRGRTLKLQSNDGGARGTLYSHTQIAAEERFHLR